MSIFFSISLIHSLNSGVGIGVGASPFWAGKALTNLHANRAFSVAHFGSSSLGARIPRFFHACVSSLYSLLTASTRVHPPCQKPGCVSFTYSAMFLSQKSNRDMGFPLKLTILFSLSSLNSTWKG